MVVETQSHHWFIDKDGHTFKVEYLNNLCQSYPPEESEIQANE